MFLKLIKPPSRCKHCFWLPCRFSQGSDPGSRAEEKGDWKRSLLLSRMSLQQCTHAQLVVILMCKDDRNF